MNRVRFSLLVIAAAMIASGCSLVAPRYTASLENVQKIKDAGIQSAKVGTFDSTPGKGNANPISLRGSSLDSPYDHSYAKYLAEALTQELTLAGKLAPDAKIVVTGVLQKNVGLFISDANRKSEVTTAGGGGDKVSYHPYSDMETGIYTVLGNVFPTVTLLKSPTDAAAIAAHSVAFVAEPRIVTTSSSSGFFTWMATDFTVMLECRISDPSGSTVATLASTGTGHAVFDELKSNFSLAGQRAATDALQKLQAVLLQSPELRK